MLSIKANTDPMTVKNPFIPQAQGINEGASLPMMRMPEGNGTPINIPSGSIKTAQSTILANIGSTTAVLNSGASPKLAETINTARALMATRRRRLSPHPVLLG
jgi:hypothetical protein